MIDDVGRKIFAQLDATLPGERINALEHLVTHFAKQSPPMTFRQLAADLAGAVPAQKLAEVENELTATKASLQQFQQANGQAAAAHTKQLAEIAQLRAALQRAHGGRSPLWRFGSFLMMYPRAAAIGAVILAAVAGGYVMLRPAAEPEISSAALTQLVSLVRSTAWTTGRSHPVVRMLDSDPWWIVLDGDDDNSSFVTKAGETLTLHCFRYYARPAAAAFGNYVKPGPDDRWQQRGRDCRESPAHTAAK